MAGWGLRWDTRTTFGAAILIFGMLLFFKNVDWEWGREAWNYWPAILVIIGLTFIFQPFENRRFVTGAIFVLIGVILIMANLEVIRLRFRDLWPVILIILGLIILSHSIRSPEKAGARSDYMNLNILLGGGKYPFKSKAFKGGNVTAILGGAEIDLRDSDMEQDEILIDTLVVMGGVEIRVPANWTVVMQGTPLLGGMEDKTLTAARGAGDRAKQLIVKGMAIMGGVEVKN